MPPDDAALVHRCLSSLDVPADERAQLDAALEPLLPRHRVSTLGGWMLADALVPVDAELADEAAALLAGRRRMATNSFAAAVAFYAYLGHRLHPGVPLHEATNACAALAARHSRDSPMVRIMLKATGGQWNEFLAGIDTWSRMLGQARRIEFEVDGETLRSIARGRIALAYSYFQLGYLQGLATFFGRATTYRWVEREAGHSELEIAWREGG